jgi:hypothetical protein
MPRLLSEYRSAAAIDYASQDNCRLSACEEHEEINVFWQNGGFLGENLRSGIRDQKNAGCDSWSPTLSPSARKDGAHSVDGRLRFRKT